MEMMQQLEAELDAAIEAFSKAATAYTEASYVEGIADAIYFCRAEAMRRTRAQAEAAAKAWAQYRASEDDRHVILEDVNELDDEVHTATIEYHRMEGLTGPFKAVPAYVHREAAAIKFQALEAVYERLMGR